MKKRMLWKKLWSKNNSWSWGMMYTIWWIYKNKCTKQGSWFSPERIDYDMTYFIDQYISSIEPPVQNEEGRWYSTSGGVTIENYIWVRHGTTWWIASWWIETLPRVKWVPTFKVECRRLGYVDDPTRQTHGRCYDVWDTVPKPEGKSIVSSKWICKIKHAADGSIEKYKARFVAIGFSQKEGIDYEETFAPVALYTSIRATMALASMMKWDLHQMDVKTALLNGVIKEEVYI